ncbi:hypothetical protein BVG16_24330 [Paenibacillus selenitireducens]|uniref:DNA-binding response regulator n=1 Tax=Paenibacillus selenitireducens TaxID=1324314 RepID=A0A1T2X2Y1_9BACL|nr:response regulator transcription factor [Paenibacillus selenitireducens]OPA74258.1 hypothetical protein BVG16_24330 [Paenibacillus selenitireducens]
MRKVFIVDDEPFILEGLTSVIAWEDFGITLSGKAYDGSEAFEALQYTGADILITDIMMRQMGGLELIERLKPLYPKMKFIVLSGYNEFGYVKEGMRLGIENYLLKPVNMKELTETVVNTVQKLDDAERQSYINQNQLDILRDNVLNRWATGHMDPTELRHRLQFLEIPIDHTFYLVAAIKTVFDGATSDADGDAAIQEHKRKNDVYLQSKSMMETSNGCFCFCDTDSDTMLIFTGAKAEIVQKEALDLLGKIRKDIKQRMDVQILITLGSMESSYLEVSQSYGHAKRLQEYFLTNSEDAIIRYDQMMASDHPMGSAPIDMFEYEQLLLSKNKPALRTYIDSLFARLQSLESITPVQLHNCAIDLILCTKQVVKDNKLNHELATSGYKQLFTALFRAHTMSQLTTHVKFIADSAIDYLSTEDDEFSPIVKQVLHQIKTRHAEELSLKTLGHKLNIHPFYLGQLFQKETGESFSDYLNAYRIKKAQHLLKTTTMKTSEISRNIGYLEPGYFYKMFRKYTGFSPTEYRGHQK